MIKIKASYENQQEKQQLLDCLGHNVKRIKEPLQQSGRFKKMYIELKEEKENYPKNLTKPNL